MKEVDVQIRRAAGIEDYRACVELQKEIWGFTKMEDIAALPMLFIGDRFGGIVLVAQEPSGRYLGFSFALIALSRRKKSDGAGDSPPPPERSLFWWSHMTAVVREYQNRDIGLRLKLAQREAGLAEGIEEIRWTFDPLRAQNAYFNVHKLGVIVRQHEENVYGYTSSPLHRGLPTDRFVAEWRLKSPRVVERVGTAVPSLILRDVDRLARINTIESGRSTPPNLKLEDTSLLLEVPLDFDQLNETDLTLARDWQLKLRTACLHYFSKGFSITDFMLLKQEKQAFYVLERTED